MIVDESSMLNLRLIEVLLGGLAESTHIVFVGDADQLPPIGAGKPFEDLIGSGIAPVVRLTQIFRQAARSMITTAAHEVNHGREPHLTPGEDQDHDFFFIDRPNAERALDTVVEIVAERAPKRFGVDPVREVQVLAPMYRGAVGIDALNERLQEELNPHGKAAVGERFRLGDRLIQTRNSHELGLMNGSIVFLRDDDPAEQEIVVETDEGETLTIPYGETATLRLAYAISVHKAQGCEVPVVVGVCHRSHARMLTRPLLYTAITRARNSCVLVGDRSVMGAAVRRDDGGGRHSGLAERLRAAAGIPRLMDNRRGGRPCSRSASPWPGWRCWRPRLRRAGPARGGRSGDPRRHRRGPQRDREPRRRRAAADPRPRASPRGGLLPGRDRRRGSGLRLRLRPGVALMMAAGCSRPGLLCDRPLGGATAARPLVRPRALRADRGADRARRRQAC